jgi:hypothetical protein
VDGRISHLPLFLGFFSGRHISAVFASFSGLSPPFRSLVAYPVWFTHLVRGSVSQHRVALEKREDALKKINLFNAFYDVGKSLL